MSVADISAVGSDIVDPIVGCGLVAYLAYLFYKVLTGK